MTEPNSTPRASVVVPALNAESTVAACVESLLALDRPRGGVEIVVVDNGSTDSTRSIVSSYPVRLLTESAVRSSYAARNLGVRESSGEIVAFTDADCQADARWLAEAERRFDDPAVGAVSGAIDSDEPTTPVERYLAERESLSNERAFRHSFAPACVTANAVYRRAVFDAVGLFEPRWPSGGDVDLSWRMQLGPGDAGAGGRGGARAEAGRRWRLVYEPAARVVHRHRSSLGSLYRQRRRMAVGAELLAAKWGPRGFGTPSRAARNVFNLALKAALVPLCAPLYPVAPGLFWRQLIGLVVRAADIAGRSDGARVARELVGPGAA